MECIFLSNTYRKHMFNMYILVGITMQALQVILSWLISTTAIKILNNAYLDNLKKTGGILLEKVRKALQKNCPLLLYGALFKKNFKKQSSNNNLYLFYLLVNSYLRPLTSKNKTLMTFYTFLKSNLILLKTLRIRCAYQCFLDSLASGVAEQSQTQPPPQ